MPARAKPEAGKRRGLYQIDSSVLFKLIRAVNLTARPFHDDVGRRHALTITEWRIMVVLASHPGILARDVADATGLDKMTVSRALGSLEKHGRLRRESDPADGRSKRIYLSDAGRMLFRTVGAQGRRREARLVAGISSAELAQMSATLDKLIDAVLRTDRS